VWVVALALVALALLPEPGFACPVCFDPNDEHRQAFLATAIFMTVLPLGMVGGVGIWLRKRLRRLDDEEAPPEPPANDPS